jgi:hypothetical protein
MHMKTRFLAPLALTVVLASCSAGPHQLTRSVDDWSHKSYVESPLLNGVLHFIPVIPIVGFLAAIGDFFITDAYAFWFKDVWDGKGTGFDHLDVAPTDGQMSSLLNDDGEFLKIR